MTLPGAETDDSCSNQESVAQQRNTHKTQQSTVDNPETEPHKCAQPVINGWLTQFYGRGGLPQRTVLAQLPMDHGYKCEMQTETFRKNGRKSQ